MSNRSSDVVPKFLPRVPQGTRSSIVVVTSGNWNHVMEGYEPKECTQDIHEAGIFEVMAMTFGIAIFLTNLIVVTAIKRGGRKLHKATFYCICNLAVADMLAGLLLLWIFGLQREVLKFRTPFSELVQKSIWTLTVWTSLLSQVVIAMDRYSHVTRGSRGDASYPRGGEKWGNKQRKRMIIFGILMTWAIPAITFVIPVLTVWNCSNSCSCHVTPDNADVIYMICQPIHSCSQINPPFAKSSMLFLSLFLLILPFIPVVLYMKIFIFVRNSSKNLCPTNSKCGHMIASGTYTENGWNTKRGTDDGPGQYSQESTGSKTEALIDIGDDDGIHKVYTNGAIAKIPAESFPQRFRISCYFSGRSSTKKFQRNGSCQQDTDTRSRLDSSNMHHKSASSNNGLRKRSQRRDMRLLRTLVIILALFVVSTVPLGLLFLISFTETDKSYVKPAKYLLTLSLLNSLINPWVYFWRFQEMRNAIKHLFCCRRRRKLGKQRDGDTCTCGVLPMRKKSCIPSQTSISKKATVTSSKDQSSSSAF